MVVLLYVKEISSVKEIFNDKYPVYINYIIYFLKCMFCILTIRDENKCYIPYKKLKNKLIIKLIILMLSKQNCKIVLSKKLLKNNNFVKELKSNNVNYMKKDNLFNYIILKILEYITKTRNKDIKDIEVSILINNISEEIGYIVKYLSMNIKRLNIVTSQIGKFKKLEEELQQNLGIPILITNSKRKSLLKADIIVNIDFKEEQLELYQVNRNAIFIQKEKQYINRKSFNGINVIDYEIIFEKNENLSDMFYNEFDDKDLLMSLMKAGKSYLDYVEIIDDYKVEIIYLKGNKGIIDKREFKK